MHPDQPIPRPARPPARWLAWAALGLAPVLVGGLWLALRPLAPVAAPAAAPPLSDLAAPPDWSLLADYHGCVTRRQFEDQLGSVLAVGDHWRRYIEVAGQGARIDTGDGRKVDLRFAQTDGDRRPPPRWWRPAGEMPPAPPGRPLDGVHVAIDPGHLGGEWARMEERWFRVGEAAPVTEGDLTLAVARLLRPRLEQFGARVSLVRDGSEPLTRWRPDSLLAGGLVPSPADAGAGDTRKLAERLFYRTAEIRARARRVNGELRPDLVLCLHFNAEAWGDPGRPTLTDRNHLHVLVNGACTAEEIALADQRFEVLRRLLQGIPAEEAAVAGTAAAVFAARTGLPPYRYEPDSNRALKVGDNPAVWARNLLANRLYQCPVLFLEPYVMNCTEVHARIQAGDYPGLRTVAGRPRPSILREYADAVAEGLAVYYRDARGTSP